MEQQPSTKKAFATATFLSVLILFFQNCSPTHQAGRLSIKGVTESSNHINSRETASQGASFTMGHPPVKRH